MAPCERHPPRQGVAAKKAAECRRGGEQLHVLTLGYLAASMKTSFPLNLSLWVEEAAGGGRQAFKVVHHRHPGIFQSPGSPLPVHITHTTDKWTGRSFTFSGRAVPRPVTPEDKFLRFYRRKGRPQSPLQTLGEVGGERS